MIGTYYRLSLADEDVGADKAESNSIQGQRGLVEGYIMARPELAAEPRQEYVDDGYSDVYKRQVVKSKIRLCIRNRSCGRFLHGGILMGIALPIPSHRAKSHDFACWWPAAAGHSRSADALPGKSNS